MAPTLVNVAIGALLAAALLGAAFDRRSVLVVLVAAALPDADAAISLVVQGATNTVLHNVFVPAIAGGLLYWDTTVRETSWLRERYGWWGVRVSWVALASFVVAGIGADLFSHVGVNVLWPIHDRFYAVSGYFFYSTHRGIVQTYVVFGTEILLPLQSPGTTENYFVASWINPTAGTGIPTDVERELTLVESGWQAVVVATGAAVLAIRFWEDR